MTAAAGSRVEADGSPGADGGPISVSARDVMTLLGDVHATGNGEITLLYRSTPPTLGAGVICPCTQLQDGGLEAACGDGIRRVGVEACDGSDLGDQTCTSLGYPAGTLRCSSTCTFDTTGCTGS